MENGFTCDFSCSAYDFAYFIAYYVYEITYFTYYFGNFAYYFAYFADEYAICPYAAFFVLAYCFAYSKCKMLYFAQVFAYSD
jgi:hypothetical protein